MKTKTKNRLILLGTVINYIVFIGLLFNSGAVALVNIVDFEEPDFSSSLCSTLLFLSTCVWIYVAAKNKAKSSLVVSASVMFVTSIIYFGFGLFQPFWYVPLSLVSLPFGGDFFGYEAFAQIDNVGIAAVLCIFLCVLDKATHIYLGAVAVKYCGRCNEETEEPKKEKKKRLFITIPMIFGVVVSVTLFISLFLPNDGYIENDEEDKKQTVEAVKFYESVNRENIKEYSETDATEDRPKGMFKFGNGTVNCTYVDNDYVDAPYYTKYYLSPGGPDFEPVDIKEFKLDDSREKVLEKMPLENASAIWYDYNADGTTWEKLTYWCGDGRNSYEYEIILINGKLSYARCTEYKRGPVFYLGNLIGLDIEPRTASETEIGEES